jgi:predicted AAA+ superfamily ATPase
MQIKKSYLQHIFSTYIQKDIKDIGKIKEVNKFNNLLKVLASQVGNLLNKTELSSLV